ncbi:MAG: hypothetical protein KatS3mg131_3546 [Candidatus Tectimicrobiota bacterium]|nr:MAG: hypothetical protein KatS3mg131_3546 [Candidatus Tectomicrobia bacterium]
MRELVPLVVLLVLLGGKSGAATPEAYREQRLRMVREVAAEVRQTRALLGFAALSPPVLQALQRVPRHLFVPESVRHLAYRNRPLPIGYGQTISQPYIVAVMTELLAVGPEDRVLEVGTGSGYQAAVLAELVRDVYSVEIIPQLAAQAQARLARLGYDNVRVRVGDGYYGWEEHAPFDAIIVTAAASHVPPPLLRQLKPGGRMVIPVGGPFLVQHLVLVEKNAPGPRALAPAAARGVCAPAEAFLMRLTRQAVALLSAATLGYEILLLRLFSLLQWHHFAYMVISLALLGYGASGTLLTLGRTWLLPRWSAVFSGGAVLFGLSAVGSFALAQRLPFNALELAWDWRPWLSLGVLYLLLSVPFLCAATCIGLTLQVFREQVAKLYAFDLLGAAGGALGIVLALYVLPPARCLPLLGALGFVAAALVALEAAPARTWWLGLLLVFGGLALPSAWPRAWLEPRLSPYKGLPQALRLPGAAVVSERFSPLGVLAVVRSPAIPFRYAPGLSLHSPVEPPEQLGVFVDGELAGVLTRDRGRREALAYFEYLPTALPYQLLQRPHVLVLGAGGGTDVLQARYFGARRIDAVELNPQLVALVRGPFAEFTGGLYDAPQVRVHVAEARAFVARSRQRYDLIQLSLLDAFGVAAAGVYALHETYLYTVEAFQDYLRHLHPGGLLAVTRWLKLPPRDSLKLFLTALVALEELGVPAAAQQVALVRSWQTTTLLVKNGPLTAADIAALRRFCATRGFDLAYYPGMPAAEANRFVVLAEPVFFSRCPRPWPGAGAGAFCAATAFP